MFRRPHAIDWKALVPKPKPRKPPRVDPDYRMRHTIDWAWRWPAWGAFKLRTAGDAYYFRRRWVEGVVQDAAAMALELPTDPQYLDDYRELIARFEAQLPGDVEMGSATAALHIERMKTILSEAESP